MLRSVCRLQFLMLACPLTTLADGFSHSPNFIVLAPRQQIASEILTQAETLRTRLAMHWLGHDLPPGVGRTLICVESPRTGLQGGFWPIDDPGRTLHRIRLTAPDHTQRAQVLAHEVTHLVMEVAFQGQLPVWANEGVAMAEDGQQLRSARRRLIQQYASNGMWPELRRVLQAAEIRQDLGAYAVAASFTQYLLRIGDAPKLFSFALQGKHDGWDSAARNQYGLPLSQLRSDWQAWAARQMNGRVALASRQPDVLAKAGPRCLARGPSIGVGG